LRRLERLFKRLKSEKRCGLIAYVTCGDPDVATTVRIVHALEAAGADAIELGVPFSDPIADGPVIQAAAQRALRTTVPDVNRVAEEIRAASEIPLIAFSYLNPLLRHKVSDAFDATLVTDLPVESKEIKGNLIFLLAPTSTDARIAAVNRASKDLIYYVSTTGVTGTRRDLDPELVARLDEVRSKVKRPLAVGFGISEHEHFLALKDHCDAIVVGSAIVRAIADGDAAGAPARAAAVVRRILGSGLH
jgi:tryptophan synthase alpha chain